MIIPENENQKNYAYANDVTAAVDPYFVLYNTHGLRGVHTLV